MTRKLILFSILLGFLSGVMGYFVTNALFAQVGNKTETTVATKKSESAIQSKTSSVTATNHEKLFDEFITNFSKQFTTYSTIGDNLDRLKEYCTVGFYEKLKDMINRQKLNAETQHYGQFEYMKETHYVQKIDKHQKKVIVEVTFSYHYLSDTGEALQPKLTSTQQLELLVESSNDLHYKIRNLSHIMISGLYEKIGLSEKITNFLKYLIYIRKKGIIY